MAITRTPVPVRKISPDQAAQAIQYAATGSLKLARPPSRGSPCPVKSGTDAGPVATCALNPNPHRCIDADQAIGVC